MISPWAQYELTADDKYIDKFEYSQNQYIRRGSRLALSYLHTLMARMYIKANKLDEADIIIEKALSNLTKSSEHFFQVEIYRLKGFISWKKKKVSNNEILVFFEEDNQ